MPRVYTSLSLHSWWRSMPPRALACAVLGLTVAACGDGGASPSPRRAIPGGNFVADEATARRELERPPPLATARHRDERPALFGSLWRAVGPAAIRDGQVENVTPDGKVAGAVHVLVPHPTDRNRLWIGTANGGVWETRNARSTNPTWRPLTDDRSSSSIAALELDPTDPHSRTLLAGFGNVSSYGASGVIGGLLYTRDGGQSWTELSDPLFADSSVTGVVARGSVLVAATSGMFGTFAPGGVFRSTDRGQSWVRIPDIAEPDTFDLTGDPANPSRLYLTTPRAVYRSDDAGAHWTNISAADPRVSALLDDFTVSLAEIDVGAGGRVFLVITRFGNGAYIGYSDGAGWTEMDLPYTPESGLAAVDEVSFDQPFGVTLTSPGHNLFTGALVEVTGLGDIGVSDGVYIAIA